MKIIEFMINISNILFLFIKSHKNKNERRVASHLLSLEGGNMGNFYTQLRSLKEKLLRKS